MPRLLPARLATLAARPEKRVCGRGETSEWTLSHAELDRLRTHGLLPN